MVTEIHSFKKNIAFFFVRREGGGCLITIHNHDNNICQQVFRIAYCQPFDSEMVGMYESECSSCVAAILAHYPDLKRKLKVHLLLHLCESMLQFGPTSAYNTER